MCCQGDVRGNDADASMTAFVLIAMQEGSELCSKTVTVSIEYILCGENQLISSNPFFIFKFKCIYSLHRKNIPLQLSNSILALWILQSLPNSIKKATEYLEGRLKSLSNPYAVAMVSYALANAGKLNKEVLFKHASEGWLRNIYLLWLSRIRNQNQRGI